MGQLLLTAEVRITESHEVFFHYEEITIIWKIKIVVSQHQISKSVCQQERYLKSYTKTLRVSPKVSSPYFGPHTQFI